MCILLFLNFPFEYRLLRLFILLLRQLLAILNLFLYLFDHNFEVFLFQLLRFGLSLLEWTFALNLLHTDLQTCLILPTSTFLHHIIFSVVLYLVECVICAFYWNYLCRLYL
jgi:hypothetical protein